MNAHRLLILTLVCLIVSCTHQLQISPPIREIKTADRDFSDMRVGYYISENDYQHIEVEDHPLGDKVAYTPYRDWEIALKKVLFENFKIVKKMNIPPVKKNIKRMNFDYVFIPKIQTDATIDSILTWPPTGFLGKLEITVLDGEGNEVWDKKYTEDIQDVDWSEEKDLGAAPKKVAVALYLSLVQDLKREFPLAK